MGAPTTVTVDGRVLVVGPDLATELPAALTAALTAAGYPATTDAGIVRIGGVGDLFDARVVGLFLLLLVLVSYAQMTQGPAASAMVELFPTRIRYTATSVVCVFFLPETRGVDLDAVDTVPRVRWRRSTVDA